MTEKTEAAAAELQCHEPPKPQKEHEWLRRMIGEWTCRGEATMGPGQPPSKFESIETVRAIGDVWIVAEGKGEMPGGLPAVTMMTLGYDPQKRRYVGTWLGSMMMRMWVYEGTVDAAGKVLTLDTEGPAFAPGSTGTSKYQDVMTLESDDHRVLTSRVLGDDGKWTQFMTAHYRRKK